MTLKKKEQGLEMVLNDDWVGGFKGELANVKLEMENFCRE